MEYALSRMIILSLYRFSRFYKAVTTNGFRVRVWNNLLIAMALIRAMDGLTGLKERRSDLARPSACPGPVEPVSIIYVPFPVVGSESPSARIALN